MSSLLIPTLLVSTATPSKLVLPFFIGCLVLLQHLMFHYVAVPPLKRREVSTLASAVDLAGGVLELVDTYFSQLYGSAYTSSTAISRASIALVPWALLVFL